MFLDVNLIRPDSANYRYLKAFVGSGHLRWTSFDSSKTGAIDWMTQKAKSVVLLLLVASERKALVTSSLILLHYREAISKLVG